MTNSKPERLPPALMERLVSAGYVVRDQLYALAVRAEHFSRIRRDPWHPSPAPPSLAPAKPLRDLFARSTRGSDRSASSFTLTGQGLSRPPGATSTRAVPVSAMGKRA